MEKGSFRHRVREGADNLPSLGALQRAISSKIGIRLDWKKAGQIGVVTSIAGVGLASLYEVGQLWDRTDPPARVAKNPNFADPTALSLRPKVSEAVTAVAALEARSGAYDSNRLRAENIDPYHPNTYMNYGVAACKNRAVALEEGSFLDRALSFLSPSVAEAAPLEAETSQEFLKCIQDIEKQRPFLKRFDINVQKWDESNIIGLNSIAFWRENLAGELRQRGRDLTPQQAGSFIGSVIPTTFRDPNTGRAELFGAQILDDKTEVDRRRAAGDRTVHWSGEEVWMAFDKDTSQVVGTFKNCDNAFIPLPVEKVPSTPVPEAVTASPTVKPSVTASPTATPQPPEEEQPGQPEVQPTPTQQPKEEEKPTPTPEPTPRPTIVPQTPVPTATIGPAPIDTPRPVATDIPRPGDTPTVEPTPRPTIVPQTPVPTATIGPAPIDTPRPVATDIPRPVALPTQAPQPTMVPAPTPRPTVLPSAPSPRPTIGPGGR